MPARYPSFTISLFLSAHLTCYPSLKFYSESLSFITVSELTIVEHLTEVRALRECYEKRKNMQAK